MGLKGLFSSGASTLVEEVGEAIDRNVTSDEERLRLKVELDKIHNDYEGELTKRLQADAQSDSWLSKNVRPLTLITLLFLFLLFSTLDAFKVIVISQQYIDLLGEMSLTALAFYFGSRGVEKITKTIKR